MSLVVLIVSVFVVSVNTLIGEAGDAPFYQNYKILYGENRVQFLDQQREIQLSMDNYSGSGFESIQNYKSGVFEITMKIPGNDSTGVVTTFYLSSDPKGGGSHDELDFEFLGRKTKPYVLQTNIFANDGGGREQRILLWFDPTANFHSYKFLWNQHQIVFFVDNIPIRIFKNMRKIGVNYPREAMKVRGTVWTADWVSNGKPVNWTNQPFKAHYRGFGIQNQACPDHKNHDCHSQNYWWNKENYWDLTYDHKIAYRNVRNKYMVYDYCTTHHSSITYFECPFNQ